MRRFFQLAEAAALRGPDYEADRLWSSDGRLDINPAIIDRTGLSSLYPMTHGLWALPSFDKQWPEQ